MGGPLRPSDSWSTTEVRTMPHTHVWTIRGFSQCDCRYLETSVKIKNGNNISPQGPNQDSHLTFRIRLHPQGNKESNRDFSFFQVFCNNANAKYRAKFSVFNRRNEETPTTVYTGTQQLHGYFEYIRRDLLIGHVQPQDELQLVLQLTITFDTITKNSQSTRLAIPEPPANDHTTQIGRDFESMFKDERLADFKIKCGDREIKVHKFVLAARSPVFAAMLEPHTEESSKNEVVINDLDYEILHEMLFYMYSGRSANLSSMALELLSAADRYQLQGLKELANHVLRTGLAIDSVCRYLVFADMHSASELKNDAIRFISSNIKAVIETEGWKTMLKDHSALVTEVVSGISTEPSTTHSTSSSSSNALAEPVVKRSRMSDNFNASANGNGANGNGPNGNGGNGNAGAV
uniref:BTB domain-containing protein n=1 Tax=Steinernema glaseri TaxID=37863 RepID=A0A1I7YDT1_9BILA